MSAELFQATCRTPGMTDVARDDLSWDLPVDAVKDGLPRQFKGQLFPGQRAEPGNPLAAKPCQIVLDDLSGEFVVKAIGPDHRELAEREVRSSRRAVLSLANLYSVIDVADLKLVFRPIRRPI